MTRTSVLRVGVIAWACACSSSDSPLSQTEVPPTPTGSAAPPIVVADASVPEPPSDSWDGQATLQCGEFDYMVGHRRRSATLRKVRARNLQVAIRGVDCDLTIIDSDLEATTLFELRSSHVRIVGGSLRGETLASLDDDSTIELSKGAHIEGRVYGDLTKLKDLGGEWSSPVLRDAKLIAYARCLAISDAWAAKAANEYLSWAAPIDKGKHPTPPGGLAVAAYDMQWCQLSTVADMIPQKHAIDDPAHAYLTAQAHVSSAYKVLRIYYTHEDFKDDAFARAPALHAAYLTAIKERETASEALRTAIAGDLPGAMERDVAARAADPVGALGVRLAHDGVLLALAMSPRQIARDVILASCETIAKDYGRIQDLLPTISEAKRPVNWSEFEAQADRLVMVTKKGRRLLAAQPTAELETAFDGEVSTLVARVVSYALLLRAQ